MAWYRPLSRNVVLSWRVKGGLIFSPNVDVDSESGAFIPPEQRFYAGGPNDVRGFERNELGPVVYVIPQSAVTSPDSINADSVRVAATGGNSLAVANVELRVPSPVFSSRLRLAAFVDAGGVWQRRRQRAHGRHPGDTGRRTAGSDSAGTGPAGRRLQPLQAAGRAPCISSTPVGNLTPVPGQGSYILPRKGKFTFHIAVGQPF